MEIQKKPRKLYLHSLSIDTKGENDDIVDEDLLRNILMHHDSRGNFSRVSEDLEGKIVRIHYTTKDEVANTTYFEDCKEGITLTFKDYILLGKPKVISETRAYKKSR